MKKIPIVMTMDDNYIIQTSLAIKSMLVSAGQETYYSLHILCGKGLTKTGKLRFESLLPADSRFTLAYIVMEDSLFEVGLEFEHIPVASYYRLMIPQVMQKFDKCIFLDGDTLVNMDFGEIYRMDIGEYYLAGVRDSGIRYFKEQYKDYCKILQIPTMDTYINAGVLLMNLKKMREDNLVLDFMRELPSGFQMMDQDILNKVCYGKIHLLPVRNNYFSYFAGKEALLRRSGFSESEMNGLERGYGVIHFAGQYKPWNNIRINGNMLWWQYGRKVLTDEIYEELFCKAKALSRTLEWEYLLNQCRLAQHTIVFGYTSLGRDVYEGLVKCGITGLRGFSDNDETKWQDKDQGFSVRGIKDIINTYKDIFVIVVSQRYYKEIAMQLSSLGIENKNIFIFKNKGRGYYDFLSPDYRIIEIMDYAKMKYGMETTLTVKEWTEIEEELFDTSKTGSQHGE